MVSEKKYLGSITILLQEREKNSQKLNTVLTKNSHFIMARLGINVQPKCTHDCTGMIILAIQGTKKEINDLAKKISLIKSAHAKVSLITK